MAVTQSSSLVRGPLVQHFKTLAIPAAIGMGFSTLYNLVDVFFAGMISTQAQAGLAVSFHPFFLLSTFAFGLGTAMSALVGNALGANKRRRARKIALQGIGYGIIGAFVLLIIGFVFAGPLMTLTTEPGEIRTLGSRYFLVLLFSLPGFILSFSANGILQAFGDAESFKRGLIGAFLANIVLDPLFVFGIPGHWGGIGFDGLAVSSVMTQTGVAAFLLLKISQMDITAAPKLSELRPSWTTTQAISAQSIPASTAMFVLVFSGFVVLFYLRGFGETTQAAYAVALRIEQIALLPVFGLTGALLPIVAQNFGAKEHTRVSQALFTCFGIGLLYMAVACPLLWVGAEAAMGLFTDDTDVIRIGVSYLRVDGAILPAYMALFAINSFLQGLKKPIWAFWIGVYRQGIGVPLFVYLFVSVLGFDVIGVWFGVATSVLTGLLVSLVVAKIVARPLLGGLLPSRTIRHVAVDPNDTSDGGL